MSQLTRKCKSIHKSQINLTNKRWQIVLFNKLRKVEARMWLGKAENNIEIFEEFTLKKGHIHVRLYGLFSF